MAIPFKFDRPTARAFLKLIEAYMNQTGVQVQADVSRDGKTTLEFVDLREQTKDERAIEINSLKEENEVLHHTIEKLEDEIQRLERELNERS